MTSFLWLCPLRWLVKPATVLQTLRESWQTNGMMTVDVTWFSSWISLLCTAMCLFKPDKDLQTLLEIVQVVSPNLKESSFCSRFPWDFMWLTYLALEKRWSQTSHFQLLNLWVQHCSFLELLLLTHRNWILMIYSIYSCNEQPLNFCHKKEFLSYIAYNE